MSISLPDARQSSDEVLEALRLRALRGCELGFSETDVAELLGVSRETASRWWTNYADRGLGALPGDRTGRPVGSGRTLSDEQARRIRDLIDDHGPEELGIPAAVWSRKAVRDLIRKACGVAMPVRSPGHRSRRPPIRRLARSPTGPTGPAGPRRSRSAPRPGGRSMPPWTSWPRTPGRGASRALSRPSPLSAYSARGPSRSPIHRVRSPPGRRDWR